MKTDLLQEGNPKVQPLAKFEAEPQSCLPYRLHNKATDIRPQCLHGTLYPGTITGETFTLATGTNPAIASARTRLRSVRASQPLPNTENAGSTR